MFNRHAQQPAKPDAGQQVVWTSTDDRTIHTGTIRRSESDDKGNTRVTVTPDTEQKSKVRK